MVSFEQIQNFADAIVQDFNPEKIILFGSYGYGTPTPDSDVDLLVVMHFEGKGCRKSSEIRSKTAPRFPLDLLSRTPEQLQERLESGDFFMREIVTKGKVLYERPHEGLAV